MIFSNRHRTIILILSGLILLSAFVESLIGFFQILGLRQSLHPLYPFTGTFLNPGPYGCYLAVAFPLAWRWAVAPSNKFQKLTGTGMAIMFAILIPASMSRTAMVACVIGCVAALSDKFLEAVKAIGWKRMTVGGLILMIAICGGYMVKKDSADGRILMWKVAAMAAAKAPAFGVGWENVAGAYGEAQERYFASGHGSEQEKLVADAPEYVFNEYLQVTLAFGAMVAIGMIVIIAGGIITAIRHKAYGFAGSASAVATVMFASYPMQFPLFVITIALILTGAWISSTSSAVGLTATAIIAVLTCLFFTHRETMDIKTDFAVAHSMHRTHNYRKSNTLLLNLLPHTADPMVLNIIGKNYRAMGLPDSAEYYLQKSVNRCPNRLYPHYLLMQLYGDSMSLNPEGQRHEAESLLVMKEKIPSPAIMQMREEAQTILNNIK